MAPLSSSGPKSKKILVVIYSLSSGGAERAATNLAQYWAQRGYSVTLLTLAGKGCDFYKLHPKVRRIALNVGGQSASVFRALRANSIRIRALRAVIRQEQPDVVVSMMTTTNVLVALAASGLPSLVIASERIHPPMFPLNPWWEQLRRWAYGLTDAVVALTRESAVWIRQHTRARHVVVIPNPVVWPLPSQPPVIVPESVLIEGRKLILGVGRLEHQKGFDLLVQAFARVVGKRPEWDLAILGEGPEKQRLEVLASSLGIAERVHLLGPVGNVGDWYSRAHLYVMSSRYEGFPNALVEALASGCPAVSFDCDTGPRDIIRHGTDGLLVPFGDVQALAEAMARLMDDERLRHRLAARAIEARERFAIDRIGRMWDELFAEVTTRRDG